MALLRFLYLALFFSLPFSIENLSLGFGINVPGEPIQIVIALVLVYYIKDLWTIAARQTNNPLAWFIAGYILWSWVSCTYSAMPVVSIKYTIIETLHVLVFFAGLALLEEKQPGFYKYCIVAYTMAMIPILLYGIYQHAQYNFAIDFSAASMRPFYRDHPLYGAVLAFLLPFWAGFAIRPDTTPGFWGQRLVTIPVLIILTISLFLSFSRAAWLTTVASLVAVSALCYYKDNLRKLLTMFVAVATIAMLVLLASIPFFQKQRFVKNTSVTNQLLSVFNWKYDVANLERLNRYKCAWAMFKEKPLNGFGNNMYKFTYLKYQRKEDMTRISLNEALPDARNGTGGNSHSDYLAALTELGLVGLLLWMGIVLSSLYQSASSFIRYRNYTHLIILSALLTFFMHVAVNNFIHDDKVAALVWMSCGLLLITTSSKNTTYTQTSKKN
jgi:O-antigen ligase